MDPRDVFISHVEEDSGTARALAAALRSQHNTTWTYEEDGIAGVSYLTQIFEAIEHCRAFVLIATRAAVKSHQVTREIEQAHETEKVIIAVRVGITHEEFVSANPILRMACGTAVTLSTDEGNLADIAGRIAESLRYTKAQSAPAATHARQTPESPNETPLTAPPAASEADRQPEDRSLAANRRSFFTTTRGIVGLAVAATCVVIGLYLILRPERTPSAVPSAITPASDRAELPAPSDLRPAPTSRPVRSSGLDESAVRQLIATFGPHIYVAPNERFLMDDPEYVLDNGTSLRWGQVQNEDQYGSFLVNNEQRVATSTRTLADDVRNVERSIASHRDAGNYRYWLGIDDRLKGGNLARTKVLVRVLAASSVDTEMQFWFFYPFNGACLALVCASGNDCFDKQLEQCGRHYGDWEHVSLLLSNDGMQLRAVYTETPGGGQFFQRSSIDPTFRSTSDSKAELRFSGSHPVIYSALSSHAHYASEGNQKKYRRAFSEKYRVLGVAPATASVDLYDKTGRGTLFRTESSYRVVSTESSGFRVVEPGWLSFDGRWGQYERLTEAIRWKNVAGKRIGWPCREIGLGAKGPKARPSWSGDFRRTANASGTAP